MLAEGSTVRLNETTYPNCFLHRSDPNDVARTEKVTFICSRRKEDAGPTNNWMAPAEAKETIGKLFDGAMAGRTMYVVPYLMGPAGFAHDPRGRGSDRQPVRRRQHAHHGAHGQRGAGTHRKQPLTSCPGLHSLGDLSPDRRFILHFPEEKLIWSIGSGYGGNALLGKKCFALRIASSMAREQGWMAEHMLILGLEDPTGKVTYMAAAFPSACGKTNLAMMVSALESSGLPRLDHRRRHRLDADRGGRLSARHQSRGGIFRRRAGHQRADQSERDGRAEAATRIFTNTAMTPSREPWWEGIDGTPPAGLIDWQGRKVSRRNGAAAQPNSRYTVPASQAPCISPRWEDPAGVPISAFIFGGRRARLAPLVYESLNWQHGVFVAATMASETTAANTGQVGVTRRDPMAMLPFCGYHMGDYFQHWLEMGREDSPPAKDFPRELVPQGRRTASFCGPASGKMRAC